MSTLQFDHGYGRDLNRNSFKFYAADGARRFACYVPYEDIADREHLPGGTDPEPYFNLDRAHACAERSYREHGLNKDGVLIVDYLR
jgi:hypothetical protein